MFSKLIIVGNLGRDPEQRFTTKAEPVTSFSMAVSTTKDETAWYRVTVFGKQADSCYQYLKKGAKVLVEGRLIPDANGGPKVYQRKDGTWAASYEVVADNVRFLSGKAEEEVAL